MSVTEEQDYYQETINLLQEEVVRLESELRLREESETTSSSSTSPRDLEAEEAAGRQIESLLAELANRDETINLLLEQSRLFEEAESADEANWEQLNQWVRELEQRVETGGGNAGALREELDTERRRGAMEREKFEADRRAFEAQRKALESESEKLRGLLSQAARQPSGSSDTVMKTLEQENRRLRAATSELARVSAAAAEAESLRDRLENAQAESARLRSDLQQVIDDGQRERKEHEVALAALRSELAHSSLKRQEEQVLAAVGGTDAPANPNLAVDERIRAFRQHLKDIHEKEAHERAQKKLSARISRLWRTTGPRG